MKKLILLTIVSLSTLISSAQCVADFTWSASGNTVQFTNTSSGTTNNSWTFGDGGTSSTTSPTYTYPSAGTYNVCLYSFYSDSVGGFCADTICQQITVQDTVVGASCNADFTWTVNGSTVQLTNTSTGTNSNYWTFGDGGNSYATNPSHTYSTPGTYDICLTSSYVDSMGGFCSDSVCHFVTIFQDSSGGNGCVINANIYSNVNEIVGDNSSTGASSYEWTVSDYGTGAPLTTVTTYDLSYYPNYTGNFWVCLTAFDSSGVVCDTLCDIVTAVFDSLDSNASLATQFITDFQLYPNPANSTINLKFDHLPSNSHALILDMMGREMVQVDITSQVTEVQVAEFPSGIYMVQLIDSNKQIIGMTRFIRE